MGPPLRSVSSLTKWGVPQVNFFTYYMYMEAPHSKKYHKYITNMPQIYHKSTTKCDIVPQKCDIVPQKGVVYYKM